MRRIVVCFLLFSAAALHCAGWGPTGHRVIGYVAEQHLTKKARKAVERILGGQSPAMASTWMDEVRSDSSYDYMTDWHWVTIPEGKTYEETDKNPNGDLLQALEHVISELKSGALDPASQAKYLRILLHLAGDLHQPLHVGARDDHGGNSVRVMWFGNQSNLHRVWDSDMIDDTRLSFTELAQSLPSLSVEQIRIWQSTSFHEWAKESQSYNDQLYQIGDGRLGYVYAYANMPVVRLRLQQAGIRLAGILNDLFG